MIKLKIPATSANIGPGFDSLGFAVNLYNEFRIEESKELVITGCPKAYQNADNLVYRVYGQTMKKFGFDPQPLNIHIDSQVPISRGLGSSSTLILAGVMAANIIANAKLSQTDILDIATEFEGHPDNLAPALYGGLTASFMEGNNVYTQKLSHEIELECVAMIPNFELSTEVARGVLPKSLTYRDAIYNHGRVGYLMLALQNGDYAYLSKAISDRLHEPYRLPIIEGAEAMLEEARSAGAVATYLSGAGPTLMALVEDSKSFINRFNNENPEIWRLMPLRIDEVGTICEMTANCKL